MVLGLYSSSFHIARACASASNTARLSLHHYPPFPPPRNSPITNAPGSRVHIGRVLKHVRSAQPNCQITAGKDYCLLWLPSRGVDAAPFAPSTAILNSLWSRFSSYQTPPNNTPSLQRETIITTMNKLWAESMRVPATPPVQAEQQQQSPPHPKVKQLPVMAVYRWG